MPSGISLAARLHKYRQLRLLAAQSRHLGARFKEVFGCASVQTVRLNARHFESSVCCPLSASCMLRIASSTAENPMESAERAYGAALSVISTRRDFQHTLQAVDTDVFVELDAALRCMGADMVLHLLRTPDGASKPASAAASPSPMPFTMTVAVSAPIADDGLLAIDRRSITDGVGGYVAICRSYGQCPRDALKVGCALALANLDEYAAAEMKSRDAEAHCFFRSFADDSQFFDFGGAILSAFLSSSLGYYPGSAWHEYIIRPPDSCCISVFDDNSNLFLSLVDPLGNTSQLKVPVQPLCPSFGRVVTHDKNASPVIEYGCALAWPRCHSVSSALMHICSLLCFQTSPCVANAASVDVFYTKTRFVESFQMLCAVVEKHNCLPCLQRPSVERGLFIVNAVTAHWFSSVSGKTCPTGVDMPLIYLLLDLPLKKMGSQLPCPQLYLADVPKDNANAVAYHVFASDLVKKAAKMAFGRCSSFGTHGDLAVVSHGLLQNIWKCITAILALAAAHGFCYRDFISLSPVAPCSDTNADVSWHSTLSCVGLLFSSDAKVMEISAVNGEFPSFLALSSRVLGVDVMRLCHVVGTVKSTCDHYLFSGSSLFSLSTREIELSGPGRAVARASEDLQDAQSFYYCPDILLMIQEMRLELQLPQRSFPTLEFFQKAAHDVPQRVRQLAKGEYGDVDVYTRIVAHWGPGLRVERVSCELSGSVNHSLRNSCSQKVAPCSDTNADVSWHSTLSCVGLLFSSDAKVMEISAVNGEFPSFLALSSRVLGVDVMRLCHVVGTVKSTCDHYLFSGSSLFSLSTREIELSGPGRAVARASEDLQDAQSFYYCPDILLMIQEMRLELQLPQRSFPTLEFFQKAAHDVPQRVRQLAKGEYGDVDVYTRIVAHWGPGLRVERVSCELSGSVNHSLRNSCSQKGPLLLLLDVICDLYRRVFPCRTEFPLVALKTPTARRAIDFLLYSWFMAPPQVRCYEIDTRAAKLTMQHEAEMQWVTDYMVRAMLFYDFYGQRVLFAETHANTAQEAVRRVNQLAVSLNVPRSDNLRCRQVVHSRDESSSRPCSRWKATSGVPVDSEVSVLLHALALNAQAKPRLLFVDISDRMSTYIEGIIEVHVPSCGIRAAAPVGESCGLLPAAIFACREALRQTKLSAEEVDAILRDAANASPLIPRDGFPQFNARFYTPTNLLGELLQGVVCRYDCKYTIDAQKCEIVCLLYVASIAGYENSASHSVPFPLGVGRGRSKREAWKAASAQALRHNFPDFCKQQERHKALSELNLRPDQMALLGCCSGGGFAIAFSRRSAEDGTDFECVISSEQSKRQTTGRKGAHVIVVHHAARAVDAYIGAVDSLLRCAIDFLLYSWFMAPPQVRCYEIDTRAAKLTMQHEAEMQWVTDYMVRAMLFYDFYGQRVLFAETHANTAQEAVRRVNQLAVSLNVPRSDNLRCRQVVHSRDESSSRPCSRWKATSGVPVDSEVSVLLHALALNAQAKPRLLFVDISDRMSTYIEGIIEVHVPSCGIRAAAPVGESCGLLPAAIFACREALRQTKLSAEEVDAILRDAANASPLIPRDGFPQFNARFYTPTNLLGELLQGVVCRYDCKYTIDAQKCEIVCLLYVASIAGYENSASHSVPFPLGVGRGRSKREAWKAASAQALRHNFPDFCKQQERHKALSELNLRPDQMALLGCCSGGGFAIAFSRRSAEDGTDFECVISSEQSKRQTTGRKGAHVIVVHHAARAVDAYIGAVDSLLLLRQQRSTEFKADVSAKYVEDGLFTRSDGIKLVFTKWDPTSNYGKSVWHACCGALGVALGGKLVLRFDGGVDDTPVILQLVARTTAVVTEGGHEKLQMRETRLFALHGKRVKEYSGLVMVSERGKVLGNEILFSATRLLAEAVRKYTDTQTRCELRELFGLLEKRKDDNQSCARLGVKRRVELLVELTLGCQCRVVVSPSTECGVTAQAGIWLPGCAGGCPRLPLVLSVCSSRTTDQALSTLQERVQSLLEPLWVTALCSCE
uniref:Uncharacterized protein n=1 Tax=Trypanosoma vivax (strain Y486) TaxID=1055687 RepID=G0TZB2_TRYVY|nr:conserved hypothetical protein, fragment [Trypanosoma vivax Y486]